MNLTTKLLILFKSVTQAIVPAGERITAVGDVRISADGSIRVTAS